MDGMCSRTRDTVRGDMDRIKMCIRLSISLGLLGPYKHGEPLTYEDHYSYKVVVQVVLYSRRVGNHLAEYTQWATCRKMGTAYINQVRASPASNTSTLAI